MTGNHIEGRSQIDAKHCYGRDNRDRDESRDQAILYRGHALVRAKREHGSGLP
jgi:hypothetical protein